MALTVGMSVAQAASIGIGVGADYTASSGSSLSSDTTGDASSGSVTTNTNTTTGVNLMVVGASIRSSGNIDQSINSSAQVQSDDSLNSYAQVVANNDPAINTVSATGNDVTVTYNRPAHLFGFIPVTMNEDANVTVDSTGKAVVAVNKPWWAFLASTSAQSDKFAAAIQSAINNGSLTVNGSLSASDKAKVLSAIESADATVYVTN